MYMLLMGDLDETMLEKLVDVFKEGKNLDQIKESLSNTLLSLRRDEETGSLSNTPPPSKYQLGDPLTGETIKNRVKTPPNPRGVTQNQNRSPGGKTSHHFDEFYALYPTKKSKKKAIEIWKRRNLDEIAGQIIENVRQRAASDDQWLRGYAPHPSTYLNGDLWEDDFDTTFP